MKFDYRKTLYDGGASARLGVSLDEYLATHGDTSSRLKYKRYGPHRLSMLETMAQIAMVFASASLGTDSEFAECSNDVLDQALGDTPDQRALRSFYLRHADIVPGVLKIGRTRLGRARSLFEQAPLPA